jgi:hypothetical protein
MERWRSPQGEKEPTGETELLTDPGVVYERLVPELGVMFIEST